MASVTYNIKGKYDNSALAKAEKGIESLKNPPLQ